MARKKLRLGVIGTGGISRSHMNAWREIDSVQLVAACDIRPEAVQWASKEYDIPTTYLDLKKMLKKEKLDLVDICTPSGLHYKHTMEVLKQGCHVVCEKPLAIKPSHVEKMIEASLKAGKLLCSIQNVRFTPEAMAAKAYIDTGALGKVYYAHAKYMRRRNMPGRTSFIQKATAGGGACMDIGVHLLDLTLWFMGNPKPITVSGHSDLTLGKRKDLHGNWGEWERDKMEVEDFAVGFVRFDTGAILVLEVSWLSHVLEMQETCSEVLGKNAGIKWPSLDISSEAARMCIDSKLTHVKVDGPTGHHGQLASVAEAVLKGKKAPVPVKQTLDVIKILDGIYRSTKLGKEVRV